MAAFRYSLAEFERGAQSFGSDARAAAESLFRERAASLARHILDATPPAGGGVTGDAAFQRGVNKLVGDLTGSREGSQFSGKRRAGVFHVVSASKISRHVKENKERIARGYGSDKVTVRLFTDKAGRIYGTDEEHYKPRASIADMKAQQRKYFKNGRMTSAMTSTLDIGRWVFINKMIVARPAFERFLEDRKKAVGTLTGGWVPLCRAVGVDPPAWSLDNRQSGTAELITIGGVFVLRFTNDTPYADKISGLKRSVDMGVRIERERMERELPPLLESLLESNPF